MARLQTGTGILTTTEAGDSLSSRALDDFRIEAVETGQLEFQVGHGEKAENCFDRIKLIKDNGWPFLLLGPKCMSLDVRSLLSKPGARTQANLERSLIREHSNSMHVPVPPCLGTSLCDPL